MAVEALIAVGWRVLVVWECWLRAIRDDEVAAAALVEWMKSGQSFCEYSRELFVSFDS